MLNGLSDLFGLNGSRVKCPRGLADLREDCPGADVVVFLLRLEEDEWDDMGIGCVGDFGEVIILFMSLQLLFRSNLSNVEW